MVRQIERMINMEVPDDLKADSGLKTHVRDAVRPFLEFIKLCKKSGVTEAAIYRYLVKHGHPVGSRSGFGAALKFLREEDQGADKASARLARPLDPVAPEPPCPATSGPSADTYTAEVIMSARPSTNDSFADVRHPPMFGRH
jgi:hypothetical protein